MPTLHERTCAALEPGAGSCTCRAIPLNLPGTYQAPQPYRNPLIYPPVGIVPQWASATASTWGPMPFWYGDPSTCYVSKPGQCVGCGAAGMAGRPCEWCGGMDIEPRNPPASTG